MTALASTDVTVVVDKSTRAISGRNVRRQKVSLTLGDGAKTYPAGGVPLPSATGMGFNRKLLHMFIMDKVSADGMEYKWDYTNNKLRIYYPTSASAGAHAGDEVATSYAPASLVIQALVEGY